mmetsp:Transcript_55422/g.119217  ORF Transcript_55422/g.119217 Transcript_55422/m.119217 type:complete len:242 (-) Transcript_55422:33-758(-)
MPDELIAEADGVGLLQQGFDDAPDVVLVGPLLPRRPKARQQPAREAVGWEDHIGWPPGTEEVEEEVHKGVRVQATQKAVEKGIRTARPEQLRQLGRVSRQQRGRDPGEAAGQGRIQVEWPGAGGLCPEEVPKPLQGALAILAVSPARRNDEGLAKPIAEPTARQQLRRNVRDFGATAAARLCGALGHITDEELGYLQGGVRHAEPIEQLLIRGFELLKEALLLEQCLDAASRQLQQVIKRA